MKKIILILCLSFAALFGDNLKNSEFLNKADTFRNVESLNVYAFSDHPNTFFITVEMYNTENKKVKLQIVQEYELPVTECSFEYIRRYKEKTFFNWKGDCDKLLSEKGQLIFLNNLGKVLDKKLLFIYYQGDIN